MARVFQQLLDEATVLVWKNDRPRRARGDHAPNSMLPETIQAKEEEAGLRAMELRKKSKEIGKNNAKLEKVISCLIASGRSTPSERR